MPHDRYRFAEQLVSKSLTHSPIVGILGQRQVGKTTLVSKMSKEYVTFDTAAKLDEATQHPNEFLQNRKKPFAIDEAQLCPELFPAAKEWVRTHPGKGQFILTGSIRFTARKLIRESLTGRISNIEVLPMTIAEQNREPLPTQLSDLMKIKSSRSLALYSEKYRLRKSARFESYLSTGGLPGICFFRDASVRSTRFSDHLDTLLNRDIQLITRTSLSPLQLRRIAVHLAMNQGVPLELNELAKAGQTSTVTAKKILFAFEALYLIRPIATYGTVAKTAYFFEDQGLATSLRGIGARPYEDILRGLYSNLRQELHYRPNPVNEIFSFRTHDGTDVPLVFRWHDGLVGFIPCEDPNPTQKTYGSARSFLKKFPESKVIIACPRNEAETRDFNTIAVPYHWLI